MKIAMVTPWVPQASGIADYAYDLTEGLLATGHFFIDVFTSEKQPEPLAGTAIYSVDNSKMPDLSVYDLIVYQMGNNQEYNGFILALIEHFPGIVHLHDLVLHHLFAALLLAPADSKRSNYNLLLSDYYSVLAMQLINHLMDMDYLIWETSDVIEVPLFEPILVHATACILHSHYTKKRVQSRFIYLPIKVIEQTYACMEPPSSLVFPEKPLVWGLFGHIIPNKQPELVIDVLLKAAAIHPVKLIVAGNANSTLAKLLEDSSKENSRFSYEYHIDTELSVFNQLLQSVDVCIVLRNPSMGETSAIVSKMMQLGKLCIVSNTCSYADLPEHIIKIRTDKNQRDDLYAAVLKLITDDGYRNDLWKQAYTYAIQDMSYKVTLDRYTDFLFHIHDINPKNHLQI